MSEIKNAYPELPKLPYKATQLKTNDVVSYLLAKRGSVKMEVLRASYVLFCNESGHGYHGINNNYFGLQADGARLPISQSLENNITGTTIEEENMTSHARRFVCFLDWRDSFLVAFEMLANRGLYIGGNPHPYSKMPTISSPQDLAVAYFREWVIGDNKNPTEGFVKAIAQIYKEAQTYIK
jgi:hypothetical protein